MKLSLGLKKLVWSWVLQRGPEVHAISLSDRHILDFRMHLIFMQTREIRQLLVNTSSEIRKNLQHMNIVCFYSQIFHVMEISRFTKSLLLGSWDVHLN